MGEIQTWASLVGNLSRVLFFLIVQFFPQQRLTVEMQSRITNTELSAVFSLSNYLHVSFLFPLLFVGTWISWQLHHWSWERDPGKDERDPAELPEEPWGGPLPAVVASVWHQTRNPCELPHQWVVVEEGISILEMLVVMSELQVECTALSHTLTVLCVNVLNYFSEL